MPSKFSIESDVSLLFNDTMLDSDFAKERQCNFRLSSEEFVLLEEHARNAGISVSSFIRRLIRQHGRASDAVIASPDFREHVSYAIALIIISQDDTLRSRAGEVEKLSEMVQTSLGKLP